MRGNLHVNVSKGHNNSWEKSACQTAAIICRQSCLVDRSKGVAIARALSNDPAIIWRMNLRVRLIPRQEPRLWIS